MCEYEIDRVPSQSFSDFVQIAEAQLTQIKESTNNSISVFKDIIFKSCEICDILDTKYERKAAFMVILLWLLLDA